MTWSSVPVGAQAPTTIKIGLLYDHTGPFAAGGSLNCWRGAKMMIDYINEKGGVLGKYKLVQVDGDGQSKAEVAINEAERLLNVEKVDILAGIYSSAHAVPAGREGRQAEEVPVDHHRDLVQGLRRPQPPVHVPAPGHRRPVRRALHAVHQRVRQGEAEEGRPRTLRLAIIHEDGAYGTDVAAGGEAKAKELGLNLVLKEGYSISAPDLSSLVTKLRSLRPDVLFHIGYNPDIALFVRQAKEQGLRLRAYIGHGAGHSQTTSSRRRSGPRRSKASTPSIRSPRSSSIPRSSSPAWAR